MIRCRSGLSSHPSVNASLFRWLRGERGIASMIHEMNGTREDISHTLELWPHPMHRGVAIKFRGKYQWFRMHWKSET